MPRAKKILLASESYGNSLKRLPLPSLCTLQCLSARVLVRDFQLYSMFVSFIRNCFLGFCSLRVGCFINFFAMLVFSAIAILLNQGQAQGVEEDVSKGNILHMKTFLKCNFPMTPHVNRSVCHNFLRKTRSYNYLLLLEHLLSFDQEKNLEFRRREGISIPKGDFIDTMRFLGAK